MKTKILTVIYHTDKPHYNMAMKTWSSTPNIPIIAVVNKRLDNVEYPKHIQYIENDRNILARAWNIGLKEIFRACDIAIVSGLDLEFPNEEKIQLMYNYLKDNSSIGILSANPDNHFSITTQSMKHGDGSFSLYMITKECFKSVGDFDENFDPAYFEDNDYLERLWQKGYKPERYNLANYFHITQGTLKYSEEVMKQYPIFMNKNLQYFRQKWGKTPEHLPDNIVF